MVFVVPPVIFGSASLPAFPVNIYNYRRPKNQSRGGTSMAEYYEPMLYMSSPEHSHTMGVEVDLKEDVDGRILNDVVEALRER